MALNQPISAAFRFTDGLVLLALGNLPDEKFRDRSRSGEGPSVAWHVGHLLHFRCLALNTLGVPKVSPYQDLFMNEGATDGAGYPSAADLVEQWRALAAELQSAVAETSDEQMRAIAPFPGPEGEQRVLDSMTFFTFHEGYHTGGISAVCKDIGLPGVSELVMSRTAAG